MEEALYLNDSQRAIIAAHGNRPGAALKNHLRDASIEASLLISVSKASFPPGRWAADGGPALAGLHDHAFSRAIDPANRIFGQDASEQATLLVEPAQALLFEQPETALRYYEVAAIQRIDQRVE
jgi:hypothetical protein